MKKIISLLLISLLLFFNFIFVNAKDKEYNPKLVEFMEKKSEQALKEIATTKYKKYVTKLPSLIKKISVKTIVKKNYVPKFQKIIVKANSGDKRYSKFKSAIPLIEYLMYEFELKLASEGLNKTIKISVDIKIIPTEYSNSDDSVSDISYGSKKITSEKAKKEIITKSIEGKLDNKKINKINTSLSVNSVSDLFKVIPADALALVDTYSFMNDSDYSENDKLYLRAYYGISEKDTRSKEEILSKHQKIPLGNGLTEVSFSSIIDTKSSAQVEAQREWTWKMVSIKGMDISKLNGGNGYSSAPTLGTEKIWSGPQLMVPLYSGSQFSSMGMPKLDIKKGGYVEKILKGKPKGEMKYSGRYRMKLADVKEIQDLLKQDGFNAKYDKFGGIITSEGKSPAAIMWISPFDIEKLIIKVKALKKWKKSRMTWVKKAVNNYIDKYQKGEVKDIALGSPYSHPEYLNFNQGIWDDGMSSTDTTGAGYTSEGGGVLEYLLLR